jgi:hypothetical protein
MSGIFARLVALFVALVDRIRANGEWARLLRFYGVVDWRRSE